MEKSRQPGTGDRGTLGFAFREDPADQTVVMQPVPPPQPEPDGGTRRVALWLAVAGGFVLLAVIAGYLWWVSDRWQVEAEEQRAAYSDAIVERDRIQAEHEETQQQLDQASASLTSTQQELATANQRLDALATEKAQATDRQAIATQVAQQAATVASALQQCIDGQGALIGFLTAPAGTYDPTQIVAYAQQVQAVCTQAKAANDQLSGLIAQLGG